ncbi:MAG: hypothetical protein HOP23_09110 [Methylococcaceae bacterium]|nr:hypothetical protein [Methylococcaceae bacterium]
MKSSYYLVIPKQQDDPQRLRDFEARALQPWIDELPTANPGLATRLIHDFIVELNSIHMSPQLRIDALELLRPSVIVIEDYLRDRLIKTGFPKEENYIKILNVLASIERSFTIGYWMVLKELTQRNISWLQGKNVAVAIQRTIKGLSSVVISHFLMGMPVPDWVWIDLHSLYRLSVKIKKDTAKVENDLFQANKFSTPEDCYRQVLMLSLANPTGLMQKEILLVYSFIEVIGPFVTLKSEPISNQDRQCVVLTDEDQPPYFQSEADNSSDSSRLYLDFTKLYSVLENKEKLTYTLEGRFSSSYSFLNDDEKPSIELLDYLFQRWAGIPLQGAPLFSDRLDRYMTIGLVSTFDLQNSLMHTAHENELEFVVQSESDRLLSCVFKKTGVLSVGSMVSFRKVDKQDNYRLIGIVDKLEVTKQNQKINFGIHLLTAQSLSVTYLPLYASKDDAPQKALFYTSSKMGGGNYIATDNFILKDEDIIRLYISNENFPVVLRNKKNIGLGYWQFTCSRISEREQSVQPQKGYDFI